MRWLFVIFLMAVPYWLMANSVAAQPASLIIDHQSVVLFDQIPDQYLDLARARTSLYLHASVGGTILAGLNCLAGNRDNLAFCAGISEPQYQFNTSNWTWLAHALGGCDGKVQDLINAVTANPNYQIYHQKFCYFEGMDALGSACCNAQTYGTPGYTTALNTHWNNFINTMNTLKTQNPTKIFVFWTTPYLTQTSDHCANDWNVRLRNYIQTNGGILFDIADIETYTPQGQITLINGLESAFPHYCGEYAHNPAATSCHPDLPFSPAGEPDGGIIRLAKAWWVLMAQIAGWNPNGSNPTPTPLPGDNDHDQDRDLVDLRLLLSRFNTVYTPYNLVGTGLIDIFDINRLIFFL